MARARERARTHVVSHRRDREQGSRARDAAERGFEVATKHDSDGICFIGPVSIQQFLLSQLERKAGDIVEYETGAVLGQHEGAFLYTLGQRKGLDLGGGPARYVVKTDTADNVVYVSADKECEALWTRELVLDDLCWISGCMPAPGRYLVRTRHTRPLVEAHVEVLDDVEQAETRDGLARIVFDERVPAVAPGQSVTIYRDEECLGGGIVYA